jgi:adenylate cyclase
VFRRIVDRLSSLGRSAADDESARTEKGVLALLGILGIGVGTLWGGLYLLADRPLSAAFPLAHAGHTALSLAYLAVTKRVGPLKYGQIASFLLLPFLVQASLGGLVRGSAVMVWAFLGPTAALLLGGVRMAVPWFAGYLLLLLGSAALEPAFVARTAALPGDLATLLLAMNILGVSVFVFLVLLYFLRERDLARARSDRLLLNILPAEIAARLRQGETTIADSYDSATVLFADIVNFTPLSVELEPRAMLRLLDEIFSRFDDLVERHGLEKIRTIGDNYMAVSGVPRRRPDHAHAMARMALDLRDYIATLPALDGRRIEFRVGMNSGPLVAGVIGRRKFVYDLWGDPVNTAARMESNGLPGRIQISRATYELIKDDFVCVPRGTIAVKGKGEMETWYLEARRAPI